MAKNVEIIIDGVRHKLVPEKKQFTCDGCTLKAPCIKTGHYLCIGLIGSFDYVFNIVEE